MKADLSGMLAGLQRLQAGLARAASGEAQATVAEAMRARGQALVLEGFEAQRAPDGSPWAPPAHDYGHPLLDSTGALKGSLSVEVGPRDDAQGFSLTFTAADEKASWHQYGTKAGGATESAIRAPNRKSFRAGVTPERQHIPARPMIPADGERPAALVDDLEATGQRALDAWMTENLST